MPNAGGRPHGALHAGGELVIEGKCGWCNTSGHGRKPNRNTRESKYKAFKAGYRKCSKVGHFEVCCRSK